MKASPFSFCDLKTFRVFRFELLGKSISNYTKLVCIYHRILTNMYSRCVNQLLVLVASRLIFTEILDRFVILKLLRKM